MNDKNTRPSEVHTLEDDGLGQLLWDKRESGTLKFVDFARAVQGMQALKEKTSESQDEANISFPDATEPLLLVPFSDWHIGSYGSDYNLMLEFMETVKKYRLRVAWIGDMTQMAIKLRGVLEVTDNALPPAMQMAALEAFADEMLPYTLWSTWDNHAVEREENGSGISKYAEIWKKRTVYFNHIGHVNLTVGKQTYKVATSHKFRGGGAINPINAQMKYGRDEAADRELIVSGDSHVPGYGKHKQGGVLKTFINCGNLQTKSGFAKRHFSLIENPDFPCVLIHHKKHVITPFWTIGEMLESAGLIDDDGNDL